MQEMQETWVQSLDQEDVLEMAAHSSILAREIPGTEEPSGLQSPWGLKESTELLNTHLHYIGLGPIRRQRHRVT